MEIFGKVGEFVVLADMCGRGRDPNDKVVLGTDSHNSNFPSSTPEEGSRQIVTRECVERGFLVSQGFSGNMYEAWPASMAITASTGKRLVEGVDLLFDVGDANRYYYPEARKQQNGYNNPDAGLNLGYSMDLCYENFGGRRSSGGQCSGVASGVKWNDPRSVFRGINRGMYFDPPITNNSGGSEVWYTDPFGKNGRTTPFVGSVRQFITPKNVNYASFISGAIDPRVILRVHDDGGRTVHAPN
jgi:hypothetical protein